METLQDPFEVPLHRKPDNLDTQTGEFLPGAKEETPDPDREEARDLTQKEVQDIYPHPSPHPRIRQAAGLGQCYFALGLTVMHESPKFNQLIKECIKKTATGWQIKFWGADFAVQVEESDLGRGLRQVEKQTGIFKVIGQIESDNPVDQIIELAYAAYERQRNKGTNARIKDILLELDDGGYSHHFLQVVLGEYYDYSPQYKSISPEVGGQEVGHTMQYGESNSTLKSCTYKDTNRVFELLKQKHQHPSTILITCAPPAEGPYREYGEAIHERARKKRDEFGARKTYMDPQRRFVARHAYGLRVKAIDEKKKSAQVIIINPWDSSKEWDISFEEFLEYFRLIAPVHILEQPKKGNLIRRIKLKKGSEETQSFEYGNRDVFVRTGGFALKISRDNGLWFVSNPSTSIKKTIQANELGKKFQVGRIASQEKVFQTNSPECSRHHYDITFTHDKFEVTIRSQKGDLHIQESFDINEENEAESMSYYPDEAHRVLREGNKEVLKMILKDHKSFPAYPYTSATALLRHYMNIDFDAAAIVELGYPQGVPANPTHYKALITKDKNTVIVFYVYQENGVNKVSWENYNPHLQTAPKTLKEKLLKTLDKLFLEIRSADSTHLPLRSEDIETLIKPAKEAFERFENPTSQEIVSDDGVKYRILRYQNGNYEWEKSEPVTPEFLQKEIQERIRQTMEPFYQVKKIIEEKNLNLMKDDICFPYISLPYALEELIGAGISRHETSHAVGILGTEKYINAVTTDGKILELVLTRGGSIEVKDHTDSYWTDFDLSEETIKFTNLLKSAPFQIDLTREQLEKIRGIEIETLNPNDMMKMMTFEDTDLVRTADGKVLQYRKSGDTIHLTETGKRSFPNGEKLLSEIMQLDGKKDVMDVIRSRPTSVRATSHDLEGLMISSADLIARKSSEKEYIKIQTADDETYLLEISGDKRVYRAEKI
ncbi:MAG: hypothetical protein AB7J40_04965 [Candidatus Altimarinota bacterium]